MGLDEAQDQLALEAAATAAPIPAANPDPAPHIPGARKLQEALDDLVAEARQWSVSQALLERRLERRRRPHQLPPSTATIAPAPPSPASRLGAALDELARQAHAR